MYSLFQNSIFGNDLAEGDEHILKPSGVIAGDKKGAAQYGAGLLRSILHAIYLI
tara:strand:- start:8671 stop:8832 length:162 start_codon:yes stop_codon:yes gene_type:complete